MLTAAQNFTAAILTVQSVSRAIGVLHSPCDHLTVSAQVLPALNKTVSVWLADSIQISPADMPRGTVFNVYQDLKTAWQSTIPNQLDTVVSIASQAWCEYQHKFIQCASMHSYSMGLWACMLAKQLC